MELLGEKELVHSEGKEESNGKESAAKWQSMKGIFTKRESILISYNSCIFRTRADSNVHKPSTKGIEAK